MTIKSTYAVLMSPKASFFEAIGGNNSRAWRPDGRGN